MVQSIALSYGTGYRDGKVSLSIWLRPQDLRGPLTPFVEGGDRLGLTSEVRQGAADWRGLRAVGYHSGALRAVFSPNVVSRGWRHRALWDRGRGSVVHKVCALPSVRSLPPLLFPKASEAPPSSSACPRTAVPLDSPCFPSRGPPCFLGCPLSRGLCQGSQVFAPLPALGPVSLRGKYWSRDLGVGGAWGGDSG